LLSDEGVDTFEQARRALEQTGLTQKITLKLRHTDRHSVWVEATMWQPGSDAGPGHGVVLTVHDVSQHRKYQLIIEELHQRNSLRQQDGDYQQPVTSQTFLDQTSEAVVIADADGQIQSVNRSFCEITGYTAQEVIGHNPSILQSGIHTAHFYEALWRSLSEKGRWKGEIWNRRKNGEVYPQLGSISIVRNDYGSLRNYVAVFSDVSKAKEAETNLFFAQNHDPLTGLPNRRYCLEKVGHAVMERRRAVPGIAVVFLDIDRFKLLNDARGHHTGDRFLQSVARGLPEKWPVMPLGR
jgi:PAS domain S-box-containing protein